MQSPACCWARRCSAGRGVRAVRQRGRTGMQTENGCCGRQFPSCWRYYVRRFDAQSELRTVQEYSGCKHCGDAKEAGFDNDVATMLIICAEILAAHNAAARCQCRVIAVIVARQRLHISRLKKKPDLVC